MPRRHTVIRDQQCGLWEMVVADPHPSLRPHVTRYLGGWERCATPLLRRELPGAQIPLIISFADPVRIYDAGGSDRSRRFGSFTTGAYDSFVVVESHGTMDGMQIDFTILGMSLFLGRPLSELKNQAIDLEDAMGPAARTLTAQLHDARTWDDRFDMLDREISRRLAARRTPAGEVLWTWQRIAESRGAVRVAALARETGCSRKHLTVRFTEQIGLPPKVFAQVLRFGHAVHALKTRHDVRLADVAADCGYYDQSHFDRDFRAFAGVTPTELLRSRRDDGGFSAER